MKSKSAFFSFSNLKISPEELPSAPFYASSTTQMHNIFRHLLRYSEEGDEDEETNLLHDDCGTLWCYARMKFLRMNH